MTGTEWDRHSLFGEYMKHHTLQLLMFGLVFVSIDTVLSQPTLTWMRQFDGFGKEDYVSDMTTDASGNVYVAGTVKNSTQYEFVTMKYDASGNRQWVQRYNSGSNDQAFSIT